MSRIECLLGVKIGYATHHPGYLLPFNTAISTHPRVLPCIHHPARYHTSIHVLACTMATCSYPRVSQIGR